MKPEARQFVEEMLRVLRREFFAKSTDKQFFQERSMLIRGITHPAAWLNDRGVQQPASEYRKILRTVIDTIKRHGNRAKIERFSAYFVHSVQEHMKHHGDEYYEAAKALRPIGAILPGVVRKIRPGMPDPTTSILAEVNKAVRSPGGRIPKQKSSAFAGDLFDGCKAPAGGLQKP